MKRIICFFLLPIFLLSSCSSEQEFFGEPNQRIMVVSDPHFLADSLTAKSGPYIPENIVSDGRVQKYDDQIMDEVVKTANEIKPDALIFTGDLTFNGEKASHQEFANILNKIDTNIKTLVIPGNHDINNLQARGFNESSYYSVDNINKTDFKTIYKKYGYDGALTYDEETLSYIYKLSDKQWIVMLDGALYEANYEEGYNLVGGYLSESTLTWLEDNLKYAKDNNIEIISASHHNLVLHNPKFNSFYAFYNADEISKLLMKYDVKMHLSGHLHIQSIKKIELDNKYIYDIASNSATIFGNSYGLISIYNNGLKYVNYRLSLPQNICDDAYNTFVERNEQKITGLFPEDYDQTKKKKMINIISKMNAYYFAGRMNEIEKDIKHNKKMINEFKTLIDNYENSYYKTFLDSDYKQNNIKIVIKS